MPVEAVGLRRATGIALPSDPWVYDVSGGDVDGDGDADILISGDNGNGRTSLLILIMTAISTLRS
jgi:hypothetical protein